MGRACAGGSSSSRTFLTRDIPQLGITIPSEQVYRFWLMIAHYHGQSWNASEIAGSLGVNYKTAQRYLDILVGSFMIRALPPWTENAGKRVRKAPKIYLRDSGLFHALQSIRSMPDLQAHPKLGASWEGLALEHVLRVLRAEPGEAFHWGTHGGADSICCWSAAIGDWGSNSSTPTRRERPSRCARRWAI